MKRKESLLNKQILKVSKIDYMNIRGREEYKDITCLYIVMLMCNNGNINPVKIGIAQASNLYQRICSIEQGTPFKIKVLMVKPNISEEIERRIKNKFKEYNIKGEWFCSDILKHINTTNKTGHIKAKKTKEQTEEDTLSRHRGVVSILENSRNRALSNDLLRLGYIGNTFGLCASRQNLPKLLT